MNDSIDWEKQYVALESQMRNMMKMSLKLMDESELVIKDILIEEYNKQKFITVRTNGYPAVYMYKCYDINDKLLDTVGYTFRNTIDISNYSNIKNVKVYIKREKSLEPPYEEEIFLVKNNKIL